MEKDVRNKTFRYSMLLGIFFINQTKLREKEFNNNFLKIPYVNSVEIQTTTAYILVILYFVCTFLSISGIKSR